MLISPLFRMFRQSRDGEAESGRYRPKQAAYYSCRQLEYGALHFSYDNSLKACCRRDFADMPELMKYTEEPIDIIEAARKIDELRRLNNEGSSSPCAGCPHLELQEWDQTESEYIINNSIVLNHYTLCNQRCNYCEIWSNKKPEDITRNLEFLFEGNFVNPSALIILGGGEPALLKSQLERIIDLCRRNGNPLAISSNSSVFSPQIEKFLMTEKRKVSRVTTSLDAGTREAYAIKHGKDDFERVIENLKKYQAAKIPDGARLIVKYILDEDNCEPDQYRSFVEMVRENGFDDIMLNLEREFLYGEQSSHFRKIRQEIKDSLMRDVPGISVELAG